MTHIEISIYIDKIFQNSQESVALAINQLFSHFTSKYRNNFMYSQEQMLGNLIELNEKVKYFEIAIVQVLTAFAPAGKLGRVLKLISDTYSNIFSFMLTQAKKNKSKLQIRIQQLQREMQKQGICKRCQKFIQTINIEASKIELGVGQFQDPFNLYEKGQCEFTTHRKAQEQEINYRKRLAEVWENKKNIQQKLYKLSLNFQKKIYNYEYNLDQTNQFQEVIKEQIYDIHKEFKEQKYKTDDNFVEQLEILVRKIFQKLKICVKNLTNTKNAQTQTEEDYFFTYTRELQQQKERLTTKLKHSKQQQLNLRNKLEEYRKVIKNKEKQVKELLSDRMSLRKKLEDQENQLKATIHKIKQIQNQRNNILYKYHQLNSVHKKSLRKIQQAKIVAKSKQKVYQNIQKSMKILKSQSQIKLNDLEDAKKKVQKDQQTVENLENKQNDPYFEGKEKKQMKKSVRRSKTILHKHKVQQKLTNLQEQISHKSQVNKMKENLQNCTQLSINCSDENEKKVFGQQDLNNLYKTKSISTKKINKSFSSIKVLKSHQNITDKLLKDQQENQKIKQKNFEASPKAQKQENIQNKQTTQIQQPILQKTEVKKKKKFYYQNLKKSSYNLKKGLLKRTQISKTSQITFSQKLAQNNQTEAKDTKKKQFNQKTNDFENKVIFSIPESQQPKLKIYKKQKVSEKKNQHNKLLKNSYLKALQTIYQQFIQNKRIQNLSYSNFIQFFQKFFNNLINQNSQQNQMINQQEILKPMKKYSLLQKQSHYYSTSLYPDSKQINSSQFNALKTFFKTEKQKNCTFYSSGVNKTQSKTNFSKIKHNSTHISPGKHKFPNLKKKNLSMLSDQPFQKEEQIQQAYIFTPKDLSTIFNGFQSSYIAEIMKNSKDFKVNYEELLTQKQKKFINKVLINLACIHAAKPNVYQNIKYGLQHPFSLGFTESGVAVQINESSIINKLNNGEFFQEKSSIDRVLKLIVLIHKKCWNKKERGQNNICEHLKELERKIKSIL